MNLIQHSSATADHQFTEGDPGTGVPATTVTAIHLNGVQNELVHIITEAGLTPDEGNFTQVLDALSQLFVGKDSSTTIPVLEVLASSAVSGVVTAALGMRSTSVVVVVKGNSGALTLHLTGSVPAGCQVVVINWNPGALTINSDSAIIGTASPVAQNDWAFLIRDYASGAGTVMWYLTVAPSRATANTLISTAVQAEANLRTDADAALQTNINSEISNRSVALSNEASIRSAADQSLSNSVSSLGSALGSEIADRNTSELAMNTRVTNLETAARIWTGSNVSLPQGVGALSGDLHLPSGKWLIQGTLNVIQVSSSSISLAIFLAPTGSTPSVPASDNLVTRATMRPQASGENGVNLTLPIPPHIYTGSTTVALWGTADTAGVHVTGWQIVATRVPDYVLNPTS